MGLFQDDLERDLQDPEYRDGFIASTLHIQLYDAFIATVSQVLALHAPVHVEAFHGMPVRDVDELPDVVLPGVQYWSFCTHCKDEENELASGPEYPCDTVIRLERFTPPKIYRQALAHLKAGGE